MEAAGRNKPFYSILVTVGAHEDTNRVPAPINQKTHRPEPLGICSQGKCLHPEVGKGQLKVIRKAKNMCLEF